MVARRTPAVLLTHHGRGRGICGENWEKVTALWLAGDALISVFPYRLLPAGVFSLTVVVGHSLENPDIKQQGGVK